MRQLLDLRAAEHAPGEVVQVEELAAEHRPAAARARVAVAQGGHTLPAGALV
jgi:hypothetical protein